MVIFCAAYTFISFILFVAFLFYKGDMDACVDNLQERLKYSEKVNYRLQRKLDEIYNKIDKVRES